MKYLQLVHISYIFKCFHSDTKYAKLLYILRVLRFFFRNCQEDLGSLYEIQGSGRCNLCWHVPVPSNAIAPSVVVGLYGIIVVGSSHIDHQKMMTPFSPEETHPDRTCKIRETHEQFSDPEVKNCRMEPVQNSLCYPSSPAKS